MKRVSQIYSLIGVTLNCATRYAYYIFKDQIRGSGRLGAFNARSNPNLRHRNYYLPTLRGGEKGDEMEMTTHWTKSFEHRNMNLNRHHLINMYSILSI
jgi:hypothetical protein